MLQVNIELERDEFERLSEEASRCSLSIEQYLLVVLGVRPTEDDIEIEAARDCLRRLIVEKYSAKGEPDRIPSDEFNAVLHRVLNKNHELYRRLSRPDTLLSNRC